MNKKYLAGLLVAVFGVGVASAQEKKGEVRVGQDDTVHKSKTESRWEHRDVDEDHETVLTAKGVRFNDDYTDVEAITPEGYFRVSIKLGEDVRRLEVTPEANGQLKRVYSVRGEVRPYDDAARSWLAKLLNDTVAGSGYDAEARVKRVLQKRGVNGVLAEISRLRSGYSRRVYASSLLEQGNLNGEQKAKLIRQAAREISSDYDKSTLLIQVLKANVSDASVREAFFAAVGTLSSDYERGRVLAVLARRDDLSDETIKLALKAVGGMSSDFEKANALIRVSNTQTADASVRDAIIEAAHTLSSDHERGRVLTAVTKKQ